MLEWLCRLEGNENSEPYHRRQNSLTCTWSCWSNSCESFKKNSISFFYPKHLVHKLPSVFCEYKKKLRKCSIVLLLVTDFPILPKQSGHSQEHSSSQLLPQFKNTDPKSLVPLLPYVWCRNKHSWFMQWKNWKKNRDKYYFHDNINYFVSTPQKRTIHFPR